MEMKKERMQITVQVWGPEEAAGLRLQVQVVGLSIYSTSEESAMIRVLHSIDDELRSFMPSEGGTFAGFRCNREPKIGLNVCVQLECSQA